MHPVIRLLVALSAIIWTTALPLQAAALPCASQHDQSMMHDHHAGHATAVTADDAHDCDHGSDCQCLEACHVQGLHVARAPASMPASPAHSGPGGKHNTAPAHGFPLLRPPSDLRV